MPKWLSVGAHNFVEKASIHSVDREKLERIPKRKIV